MGKLARRLENRKHPLFQRAKDLRSCALYCWREDEDDAELRGLVEENLSALPAPDFDTLIALALEDCELLPESDDVIGTLLQAVAEVSESIEDPDGFGTCVLFAMPLQLTATVPAAQLAHLGEEQREALQELLIEHELLAEESEVTFLPRLLSPQEADALAPGDVYALSRALDEDGPEAALSYLSEFRTRKGWPEVAEMTPGPARPSYGVLVGLMQSDDEVPFVMSRLVEIEHEALHTEDAPDDRGVAHAELVSDMREELDQLNEALAEILSVSEAQATEPADHWNALAGTAIRLERAHLAHQALTELARKHCAGDLRGLRVGRPSMEFELATYPVLRGADGATLGVVHWAEGRHEDWSTSLGRFLALLAGLGIEPAFDHEELHSPDKPLH